MHHHTVQLICEVRPVEKGIFAHRIDADEKIPGQDILLTIVKRDDIREVIVLEIAHIHIQNIVVRTENDIDVVPYPRASQGGVALQHIKLLIADGEKAILGGMNWGSHSTMNHDGSIAIEKLPGEENSVVDNLLAQHFNPDWKLSWERIGSTRLMAGPLNEAEQANYSGINKEIKQENVEYYNLLKDYFDTPEAKGRYASGNLDMITPNPIENPEIKVLGTKTKDLESVGEKGKEATREYLMDKIKTAHKMRAELFVLTDKELVENVIKRHNEGKLDAKFVIDPNIIKEFPYCENAYDELKEAGVPIRLYKANNAINQRMHAKWAVFDDRDIMIGSTNWSAQGLNQNMGKGQRADYDLSTEKIDTRIQHSLKKAGYKEDKLQISRLDWQGDEASYENLKARKAVLQKELAEPLKDYLGFRHVFRHSYGYELDWERLNPLFSGMSDVWQKVKADLEKFLLGNSAALVEPSV